MPALRSRFGFVLASLPPIGPFLIQVFLIHNSALSRLDSRRNSVSRLPLRQRPGRFLDQLDTGFRYARDPPLSGYNILPLSTPIELHAQNIASIYWHIFFRYNQIVKDMPPLPLGEGRGEGAGVPTAAASARCDSPDSPPFFQTLTSIRLAGNHYMNRCSNTTNRRKSDSHPDS